MNKAKFWIILVGILIGALSYWRIPYVDINLFEFNMWLFVGFGALFGAFMLKLLFNQNPWKVSLLITLGVILSMIIRIVYDVTFWDSTSHNLAPLEIVFAGVQSFPLAFVGANLALLIKKNKK